MQIASGLGSQFQDSSREDRFRFRVLRSTIHDSTLMAIGVPSSGACLGSSRFSRTAFQHTLARQLPNWFKPHTQRGAGAWRICLQ